MTDRVGAAMAKLMKYYDAGVSPEDTIAAMKKEYSKEEIRTAILAMLKETI